LRRLIQPGVIAIPRTAHPSRAREHFDIFDFGLTEREMTVIHGLTHPDGRLGDIGLAPQAKWTEA
jgi:2,5-diketo-D-gluconate reductase A